MSGNDKVTDKGAVEISDEDLESAAGGAADYLLQLDGVKGESKLSAPDTLKISGGGINPGSIRTQKV